MMGTYNKNCFMVTNTEYCEDCTYTTYISHSHDCLDLYMADKSELCVLIVLMFVSVVELFIV